APWGEVGWYGRERGRSYDGGGRKLPAARLFRRFRRGARGDAGPRGGPGRALGRCYCARSALGLPALVPPRPYRSPPNHHQAMSDPLDPLGPSGEVTRLLDDLHRGEPVSDELFTQVYEALHRIARSHRA